MACQASVTSFQCVKTTLVEMFNAIGGKEEGDRGPMLRDDSCMCALRTILAIPVSIRQRNCPCVQNQQMCSIKLLASPATLTLTGT